MFSVITNIYTYNKKTKETTLMKFNHSHRRTGKVSFDNSRCSMCALRVTRHISIRYSSSYHTRVNMRASIFFTAAMIRAFRSGLVCRRALCVLLTKFTLYSSHRLTRVTFQHTKRLLPRSGHFPTTYMCIA
jgi:hypothetical protein